MASGDLVAARARADALLAKNPKDVPAILAKAKLSAFDRDLAASRAWLQKAQDAGAPFPELNLIRANLSAQEGQLDDAQALYERVIAQTPDRAEAHFGLGMARVKAGSTETGLTSLKRAVELAPKNAAFHYRYGQALIDARRTVEGKAELQEAIKIERRFLPAYLALQQIAVKERNLPLARMILDRGLSVLPDHPRLLAAVTNIQILLGDLKGASKTAITLAGKRPKDPEAQANLALLLMLQGKRTEAMHICRTQASLGTSNATLHMVEAMYWEGEKPPRLDEAIRAYETAMSVDPSDYRAANNLGQLLLRMSEGDPEADLERALTVLEEAVRRQPTQLEPRLNLALVLARRGEASRATEALQLILDANLPDGHPLRDQAERLSRVLAQKPS